MVYIIERRKILVIGATGAQGRSVIEGLIQPDKDGNAYKVVALTRNRESAIKKWPLFSNKNVKVVQGELKKTWTKYLNC